MSITSTHPKDSSRIVLVVCNAAAAQSALSHHGVETSVGVFRVTATAAWWLHESVDGSIASVLLLDLSVPLSSDEEEDGAQCRGDSNNTNHHSCDNGSGVGTLLVACVSSGRGCDVNDTRCKEVSVWISILIL